MTQPKIGIVGALMALGGFLAVRYMQRSRAAQAPAARDLSRWEGEGGAVAAPSATPSAGERTSVSAGPAANGSANSDGNNGAWPFPHS